MKFWICLALSGLLTVPAHAATDDDFTACDGYEAPKGKSDGISKATWLWGMAARTADIRRVSTRLLRSYGVEACDRALADPRLKPEFAVRRANLLQGKALHAIDAGQSDLALTLVDESDKAGAASEGPYFARSIGAGNMAVRAYALIALDRREEATQAIDALLAARRWSHSIRELGLALEGHMDNSAKGYAEGLRSAIPFNPKMARSLFWSEFVEGNYQQALDLYPVLDFGRPNMRGGWSLEGEDLADAKLLGERSSAAGAAAYAMTVLGRASEGRAAIAEVQQIVEAALVPPPPRANGKPPRKTDVDLYQRRKPLVLQAKQTLEQWQKAIDFRLAMDGQSPEAMEGRFVADGLNKLPILPDILGRFAEMDPALKADIDKALGEYRQALDKERIELTRLDAETLMSLLPRPETPGAVPVLKPAGDGYFLTDSGLSREREDETDVWTIRYTHNVAPMVADEELAMFGAAQTAQKLGFDSFVVLQATSIVRTTTITGMYAGGSVNSGYEAQLRVRFVNAEQVGQQSPASAWRLISAKQVISELETRYEASRGVTVAF